MRPQKILKLNCSDIYRDRNINIKVCQTENNECKLILHYNNGKELYMLPVEKCDIMDKETKNIKSSKQILKKLAPLASLASKIVFTTSVLDMDIDLILKN